MAYLEKILRFVLSHGFVADIAGDAVRVEIPWVHVETRAEGVDVFHVRTAQEARNVLGY